MFTFNAKSKKDSSSTVHPAASSSSLVAVQPRVFDFSAAFWKRKNGGGKKGEEQTTKISNHDQSSSKKGHIPLYGQQPFRSSSLAVPSILKWHLLLRGGGCNNGPPGEQEGCGVPLFVERPISVVCRSSTTGEQKINSKAGVNDATIGPSVDKNLKSVGGRRRPMSAKQVRCTATTEVVLASGGKQGAPLTVTPHHRMTDAHQESGNAAGKMEFISENPEEREGSKAREFLYHHHHYQQQHWASSVSPFASLFTASSEGGYPHPPRRPQSAKTVRSSLEFHFDGKRKNEKEEKTVDVEDNGHVHDLHFFEEEICGTKFGTPVVTAAATTNRIFKSSNIAEMMMRGSGVKMKMDSCAGGEGRGLWNSQKGRIRDKMVADEQNRIGVKADRIATHSGEGLKSPKKSVQSTTPQRKTTTPKTESVRSTATLFYPSSSSVGRQHPCGSVMLPLGTVRTTRSFQQGLVPSSESVFAHQGHYYRHQPVGHWAPEGSPPWAPHGGVEFPKKHSVPCVFH